MYSNTRFEASNGFWAGIVGSGSQISRDPQRFEEHHRIEFVQGAVCDSRFRIEGGAII
jgi:hypothetical protein